MKYIKSVIVLISFMLTPLILSQDLISNLSNLQGRLEKLHYELLKLPSQKVIQKSSKEDARREIQNLNISDELKAILLAALEDQPSQVTTRPAVCPRVTIIPKLVISDELKKQLDRASSEERQIAIAKLEKEREEKIKKLEEEAKKIDSDNVLVNHLVSCIAARKGAMGGDDSDDEDSDWSEEEGED